MLILPATASAESKLKPETVKAWDEYVPAAEARMQERLTPNHPFLMSDEDPERAARLRNGEILVSPASPQIPKRVPSGLIHDWSGEVFIPNVTMRDVLSVVRDYGCYKQVYHPVVIDSKTMVTGESQDQFFMLLMNKSLISKTALDTNFRSTYYRVDDRHWYSISEATRVQEIEGYGTDTKRMLPQDQGTGLIWRTLSITRFEERDGGVYVELEAIVLSRDIPFGLHWVVEPIVRRVSRESMSTSLRETEQAVHSAARRASGFSATGSCSYGTTNIAATGSAGVAASAR